MGNAYELVSDLPAVLIPEEAILMTDGRVMSAEGEILGVAVAIFVNANVEQASGDPWLITESKRIRQAQVGF